MQTFFKPIFFRKLSSFLIMSFTKFLMGAYKNCYSRVCVFCPSCALGVDSVWDAWRTHVKGVMEVPDDEQTMWDSWAPSILEENIERHKQSMPTLRSKLIHNCFVFLCWLMTLPMQVTRSCIQARTF